MKLVHSYNYGHGGIGDMLRSMFSYFILSRIYEIDYYLDFSKTDLKYCFDNSFDYNSSDNIDSLVLSYNQIESKSNIKTTKYINFILNTKNSIDIINVVYSNIFNFVQPEALILYKKDFLNFLRPSEAVKNRIKELLLEAGLKEHEYKSIHVRCGDQYMSCVNIPTDNRVSPGNSVSLIRNIVEHNKSENFQTVLFTDNESLKNHHEALGVKIFKTNIIHNAIVPQLYSEEMREKNKKDTVDTVVEFFLMASSKSVMTLTDSGFSFWSTFFYNVPLYRYKENIESKEKNEFELVTLENYKY